MFFFMYGLYVICLMLIGLSIVFENDRFQKRVFHFVKNDCFEIDTLDFNFQETNNEFS